ncbi:unnamed protein product [Fraxinus pennsylvanica]|uniref:very-long-chain 3-oxoacyl-CoA synthase n=1 Tax=Fraxinus pennsylvanica TaxID=56036 RepID=A0AAD1ZQE7_9LAMI|nr:unnamed protein product [Fraxinus pennsylvanica]
MGNEQTNSKTGKIGVEANLPNFPLYVRLKYVKLVKLGYHYLISKAIYLLLFPLLWIISAYLTTFSLKDLFLQLNQLKFNLVTVVVCSFLMVLLGTFYFMTRLRNVYLMDFACFKPKPELMCSKEFFVETSRKADIFTKENLGFQKKILERSGIGQKSYISESLFRVPVNLCISEDIKEAEMVMFGAIDDLLAKTAVKAEDIGILVVNCSLFSPTPSLSAMVVNHYKLRGNIVSYNLGGMGCSAGLITIDLAKQLLQVHPNSYALVVTMENMTLNWYLGNNRSMLVTNCLFRMGGAAILLSNNSSDRHRSKYHLIHTVRTHKGADEKSYGCILQEEDDMKKIGVSLSKDLMAVAGDSLKTNITTLGPLVLPMSEQLLFFVTLVARKVLKMKIRPYVPDFKLAFEHFCIRAGGREVLDELKKNLELSEWHMEPTFEHFCIHAGGRAVLDELKKNLELSEWHMEPSRMTLYRFGNTSSSLLWYEMAYSEAKGRIRRGDRSWQIAFGSGFKCNSAVWRALRTVDPAKEKNPWMEEINDFPVEDELKKNLELSEWHMEPSRMTLYRFGNTSSSSLWYELAYSEAKGRIRRGDRTWQIAFGSGFKCNSAVWRALRSVDPAKEKNPWMEEINDFPVEVPRVAAINN